MKRMIIPAVVLFLFSCNSEIKKQEEILGKYDKFLGKELVLDSLPDAVVLQMHDFAVKYPNHEKSEKYLYMASLVTEARGNYFETAKWSADFVSQYPQSKDILKAMIAAATNYERSGSFENAIKYYEMAAEKFPKSDLAQQGKKNAEMLKMGLVTPEQQFEYIMKQKDSASAPTMP